MPSPSPERIDPRRAHTRQVVLEAASGLLTAVGFERVTIDAVAERSGVARSTIYRNWSSRGQLLVDAFDRLLAHAETPDTGSVAGDLRALADAFASGLEGEPWGRMLPSLVGAASHDDDLRRACAQFIETRLAITGTVFDRARVRGDVPKSTPSAELAEMFTAPFFFRHLVSQQVIDEPFIERHVQRVVAIATG